MGSFGASYPKPPHPNKSDKMDLGDIMRESSDNVINTPSCPVTDDWDIRRNNLTADFPEIPGHVWQSVTFYTDVCVKCNLVESIFTDYHYVWDNEADKAANVAYGVERLFGT